MTCLFVQCKYDCDDVNIFNVWTRDVQSCVVSALEVYSIVYILLCFLLLTVILKAYELRSFQSSDRHGSPKILTWNRDRNYKRVIGTVGQILFFLG